MRLRGAEVFQGLRQGATPCSNCLITLSVIMSYTLRRAVCGGTTLLWNGTVWLASIVTPHVLGVRPCRMLQASGRAVLFLAQHICHNTKASQANSHVNAKLFGIALNLRTIFQRFSSELLRASLRVQTVRVAIVGGRVRASQSSSKKDAYWPGAGELPGGGTRAAGHPAFSITAENVRTPPRLRRETSNSGPREHVNLLSPPTCPQNGNVHTNRT